MFKKGFIRKNKTQDLSELAAMPTAEPPNLNELKHGLHLATAAAIAIAANS